MIWIFDRNDRLKLVISNDLPEALPVYEATMHEVLNGDINLEFEVPIDHKHAALIEEGMSAAVQRENGAYELFIISEIQTIKGSEETLFCICRHAVQELKDDIIEYYFADRKHASIVLPDLLLGTRWTAGIIKDTSIHDITVKNEPVLKALTTFIERWQGEITYTFEITSEGIVKRIINFTDRIGWQGENALRRFEWNRDLIEVTRIVNEENIKTALIGIGQKPEPEPTDEPATPPTPDPVYNTNLLTAGQQIPDSKYDLNGWTWGGSVTEEVSSSVPSGLGAKVKTSLYITQAEKATDFMVINTAERKTSVTAGQEYTASVYVKCNQAKQLSVWLEFYPSGKGELEHFETKVSVAANTWTRLTVTGTAPDKAYSCMLEARCYAPAIGTQLFFTAAKLEIGDIATPFDKPAAAGEPEQAEATTSEEDKILLFTDTVWATPTNPANKPAGQSYIEDPEAREKYGRLDKATGIKRNRFGFYENKDATSAEDLLDKTWQALQILKTPSVTYKLKVLNLAKVEGLAYKMVWLGDQVAVIDEDLGDLMARCLEIKHNLLEEEESELLLESFMPMLTGGGAEDPSIRLDEIELKLGEKLDRGETIYTDWLEEEMAALKERVLAGGGTVTITETDGIIIEEDPVYKQGGALRLLGGMLALADTFDFRLNTYNWRAFGTGEGFLADLVETGFLRFDRSKGGTLQLGGEVIGSDAEGNILYENGTLVVYGSEVQPDGRPIVVSLNGDQGGFDKLSIGELTNIQGTNILTSSFDEFLVPLQTSVRNIQFYVDPIDGDDNNIGSIDAPKATIQACIDLLPKFIDRTVYIYYLPTLLNDADIILEGFMGNGWIQFELWDVGAKTRYIRDWADGSTANPSSHWVEVRGVRADGSIVHANGNTYPERITFYNGDTMQPVTATNGARASNNDLTYNQFADLRVDGAPELVDIYLGGLYDCARLEVYHYWIDGRTYYKTKTQISEVGGNGRWYTIFDSARQGEYSEPTDGSGKRHQLKYAILNGRIQIDACMVNVKINGIWVNAEGRNTAALNMYHSNYVEVRDSVFFGDPNYAYAVYANGSNARMIVCEVNLAKTSGLIAAYGGTLEITDVVGSGFPYALTAHGTGQIGGSGKSPLGTTAHTRSQNGGDMNGSYTPTAGQFFKSPIVQKTTTWTANDTQSLFGSNWTLTDYLYQGKRPTETTSWYGVMFFNAADFSELAGRTIKKVRLKLQRSNNTGENTARKPKIYYNMQTAASGSMQTLSGGYVSDVSFTWGQEKWITLPNIVGEKFRDGQAKSLVLWVGSSESDYMKLEPKATLEITHG